MKRQLQAFGRIVPGKALWPVLGAGLASGLMGLGTALHSVTTRGIINAVADQDLNAFYWNIGYKAALVLAEVILYALMMRLSEYAATTIEIRLKAHLYGQIMESDVAAVAAKHSGEWTHRLMEDCKSAASGIVSMLTNLTGVAFHLAAVLVLLGQMVPEILGILLAGSVVMAAACLLLRRIILRRSRRVLESYDRLNSYLQETIESHLVIKAFARTPYFRRVADERMEETRQRRMEKNTAMTVMSAGFFGIMRLAYLVSVIYGGLRIFRGTFSYGEYLATIQLVAQLHTIFASAASLPGQYYGVIANMERILEVEGETQGRDAEGEAGEAGDMFDREETDEAADKPVTENTADIEKIGDSPDMLNRGSSCNCKNSVRPDEVKKNMGNTIRTIKPGKHNRNRNGADEADVCARGFTALALERVWFRYPGGDWVLRGWDLEIRAHEYVAFVGESGSGKSTACRLLTGLYRPECGHCVLRLEDGRAVPVDEHCRRLFAYVPQENLLLGDTVRQAVVFGDVDREREDESLWEALRIACADEFVGALDGGLDAPLGERGAGLSEGQRQRLAVARAIFAGAPVLVLDEATSALDGETEARLLQNLRGMTDKTVIIVTHRPAALEICDRSVEF